MIGSKYQLLILHVLQGLTSFLFAGQQLHAKILTSAFLIANNLGCMLNTAVKFSPLAVVQGSNNVETLQFDVLLSNSVQLESGFLFIPAVQIFIYE